MTRKRAISLILGLTAGLALTTVAVLSTPAHDGDDELDDAPAAVPLQGPGPKQAIAMPRGITGLEVRLGLKDPMPTNWEGQIRLSEGRVIRVEATAGTGVRINGASFAARTERAPAKKAAAKKAAAKKNTAKKNTAKKKQATNDGAQPAILSVIVEAPRSATVTIATNHGNAEVKLADLEPGTARTTLDDQIAVTRQAPSLRLTPANTEDDYPAAAKAADGSAWLAYVEYRPEQARLNGPIAPTEFDTVLVPRNHGDRILLRHYAEGSWQPAIPVTEGKLDVWRPTVAIDGQGQVHVAWAEQKQNNWDIYRKTYNPRTQAWTETRRVTDHPGSDFHVVATTNQDGAVWLAWQAWRDGNYDILSLSPSGRVSVVSNSQADDWSPTIAANGKGQVFVAWDTYDKGNFDVRMRDVATPGEVLEVASSARFEARPSLASDRDGRVWIAYESGDEQWGKDYSSSTPERVPVNQTAFALYINRTVRVACLVDGALQEPVTAAADLLKDAYGARNMSLPRLTADETGGLWMLVRHHPLATGAGEAWVSSAMRYAEGAWSRPQLLPHSSNLLDNRPACIPIGADLLVVGSSDTRANTAARDQDDLFAAWLEGGSSQPVSPKLQPVVASAPAEIQAPHPNEASDKQRIRAYRIEQNGKALRLLRGEFHRHTEFSSHRDQDGLLEDAWRYALDAADHDWMGDGDHLNGSNHEYMWWLIQKMTDLHHNADRFVAVHSYERSVVYPSGHRNVIMPKRGIRPLPIGPDQFGTAEQGSPDIKNLYAYLKHFGGMCASHTSGTNMGTDWRDNDSEVEPVVEIYQGHRHNYEHFGAPRAPTAETQIGGYQPAGFIWNALERGYKLGFQSSSDHVSTHWSYAIVLTEDHSRQGIIDAFKKRHSYAATDNIILDVRSGDHLMGDIFTTPERPSIQIVAHGTAPIVKLHVIRDNKYALSIEPNQERVSFRYTDDNAKPGESHYYYVRVEQADGNLAWASPMWVTFSK